MVAYNVQSAVDTTNRLIVAHEVTNVGTDRSQLATMAQAAKAARRSDNLDVVADRGYFKGEEILACEQAGVAVTLPKPQTSGAKSAGRFGKPDFVYLAKDDVYRCPAGEKFAHHFTADEDGQKMRIYLTKACRTCPLKHQCTTANERRIKRWEHQHVVEAAQTRLDQNPQAMRVRRETVEHPFATLKMRMGATHFLMKRLPNVAAEMALNVLSYNLTRVLNIVGVKPLPNRPTSTAGDLKKIQATGDRGPRWDARIPSPSFFGLQPFVYKSPNISLQDPNHPLQNTTQTLTKLETSVTRPHTSVTRFKTSVTSSQIFARRCWLSRPFQKKAAPHIRYMGCRFQGGGRRTSPALGVGTQ